MLIKWEGERKGQGPWNVERADGAARQAEVEFVAVESSRGKEGGSSHFGSWPFSLELSVLVDTGLGVWFVLLCCCRDPCDRLAVCCCRDPGDCLSLVQVWSLPPLLSKDFSGQEWLAMVFKRREGGSLEKRGRKECWQVRSRFMGERSGFVNSARSRMCGRGGVAGDAETTSPMGCVGRTGRQPQQRPENGQRALRLRVERRIGRLKVRRQRSRSFEQNLSVVKRRMGKEPREGKAFHPGEKVAWRKSGEWTLRMRSRAERSWMGKGESCRRICETLKSSRVCRKRFRTASRIDMQQHLHEVEQRRHDLMPEHQKVQQRSQKIQSIQ